VISLAIAISLGVLFSLYYILKRKLKPLRRLNKQIKIRVLGPNINHALPNTILLLIDNIKMCNKSLVKELNKKRIYVSVGSACQTEQKASHVLVLCADPYKTSPCFHRCAALQGLASSTARGFSARYPIGH